LGYNKLDFHERVSLMATAFLMTLFAGMSTVIGSFISLFMPRTNTKFLSAGLGFSAGVMIYVSFAEIFVKARDSFDRVFGTSRAMLFTVLSFFGGMLVIALIDKLIPEEENPHEFHDVPTDGQGQGILPDGRELKRAGIFTALAVGIHNFPEGLVTFITALYDPNLALPIVVAIALHNIPEGIAVSAPIYYATGSRIKAFWYSALSGLAEPIGALVGYWLLMPFLNDAVYGILFGAVAGIMVFISFDELLPAAQRYGEHHLSLYSLIAGMAVMAISLVLLA